MRGSLTRPARGGGGVPRPWRDGANPSGKRPSRGVGIVRLPPAGGGNLCARNWVRPNYERVICPVRDANPSRQGRGTRPPSDFCRFPSRVSCPPHGSREVAYYGALVEGIFAPPLTGREARPSRVPSSNSQIFEPPFYNGGSKSATCVGIVPLPPAGGRTIPSA